MGKTGEEEGKKGKICHLYAGGGGGRRREEKKGKRDMTEKGRSGA